MDIDKEIEEAMDDTSTWQGSPDGMWQKVEGEIRRRQAHGAWVRRLAPAAAAAAALVAVWVLKPGIAPLPPQPPGEIGGGPLMQPPEPVRKMPSTGVQREPNMGRALTLPEYLNQVSTIVLGQVVSVQGTNVPCVDPHDNTPPPPDHPKAQGWAPTKCDPFPAMLFTIKTTRVFKGDPGETFQVQQLVPSERVVHPDGKPDPLMNVGSTYLFFFHGQTSGLFEEYGYRLELGVDNRLRPVKETPTALQGLAGLTPDEAAVKLRHP